MIYTKVLEELTQHHISEDCNFQPGGDLQLIMLVTGLLQRIALLERKITWKQRYSTNINIVRYEVLTIVYMKIKVIWDVALCSLVSRYQSCRNMLPLLP